MAHHNLNDVLSWTDLIIALEVTVNNLKRTISSMQFQHQQLNANVQHYTELNNITHKSVEQTNALLILSQEAMKKELDEAKQKLSHLVSLVGYPMNSAMEETGPEHDEAATDSEGNVPTPNDTECQPTTSAAPVKTPEPAGNVEPQDDSATGAVKKIPSVHARCNELEHQVERYHQGLMFTKRRVAALQDTMMLPQVRVVSNNGRLIWRIEDFKQRKYEAKTMGGITMRSPIFSNDPFGYMLQMEANMHAVGLGGGQYVMIGLVVLNGPYDELLKWPVRLNATLTIHDLPPDGNVGENIVKKFTTNVRAPTVRGKKYVKISHKLLSTKHYTKNNTIFVELVIDDVNSDGSME